MKPTFAARIRHFCEDASFWLGLAVNIAIWVVGAGLFGRLFWWVVTGVDYTPALYLIVAVYVLSKILKWIAR